MKEKENFLQKPDSIPVHAKNMSTSIPAGPAHSAGRTSAFLARCVSPMQAKQRGSLTVLIAASRSRIIKTEF